MNYAFSAFLPVRPQPGLVRPADSPPAKKRRRTKTLYNKIKA